MLRPPDDSRRDPCRRRSRPGARPLADEGEPGEHANPSLRGAPVPDRLPGQPRRGGGEVTMPDDRGESGGLVTANGDLTLRDYFAAAALTGLGEVCRKQLGGSPRLTA